MKVETYICDRCQQPFSNGCNPHTIHLHLSGSNTDEHFDICGMCVNQFKLLMSGNRVRAIGE